MHHQIFFKNFPLSSLLAHDGVDCEGGAEGAEGSYWIGLQWSNWSEFAEGLYRFYITDRSWSLQPIAASENIARRPTLPYNAKH